MFTVKIPAISFLKSKVCLFIQLPDFFVVIESSSLGICVDLSKAAFPVRGTPYFPRIEPGVYLGKPRDADGHANGSGPETR